MHVIQARNVNGAYSDGLWWLKTAGVEENSRVGRVITSPVPVTTVYQYPIERVLFDAMRDANPFFHLMEFIWMMAGSQDVQWLARYNPRMQEFSDDGETLNGAYGYRWRHYGEFVHDFNQIRELLNLLRRDPGTRRAVLAMWYPPVDLGSTSLDIPCNTHIYFRHHNSVLEMTVCCRSNDAVWGAYGSNIVHFSMLQELLARDLGLGIGPLYQISNNFHIYERHWNLMEAAHMTGMDPYPTGGGTYIAPLLSVQEYASEFIKDCEDVVKGNTSFRTHYMEDVVQPAMEAHGLYVQRQFDSALSALDKMIHCDWKLAMTAWLERRRDKHGRE